MAAQAGAHRTICKTLNCSGTGPPKESGQNHIPFSGISFLKALNTMRVPTRGNSWAVQGTSVYDSFSSALLHKNNTLLESDSTR